MTGQSSRRQEFGDFQTPDSLAKDVCDLLGRTGLAPASMIEPTCGDGSFLLAATEAFPNCRRILGYDINRAHLHVAGSRVGEATLRRQDFFTMDWLDAFRDLPEPILVLGNPPWVTNSALGVIGGTNLPDKSNHQGFNGLDALTGKSNFDISEWMITRLLECLSGRSAVLAMLCKTAVARKVLRTAWVNSIHLTGSDTYSIDAFAHFGAAVDACLLVCVLEPGADSTECRHYDSLGANDATSSFALRDGRIVADRAAYDELAHLRGRSGFKWRSGVKHDCARIMELRPAGDNSFINGLGEIVTLEEELLYPMLKSSDVAKGLAPSRVMLLTQKNVGDETESIAEKAPLTWQYLESHKAILDSRASAIYRNRPRFSMFGVGEYSFAPWKVAISGFYKSLDFRCIGMDDGKPIVLDDTCYFLPCRSESEARELTELLNSKTARTFFESLMFWDAKRPITAGLLSSLDIELLAAERASDGD